MFIFDLLSDEKRPAEGLRYLHCGFKDCVASIHLYFILFQLKRASQGSKLIFYNKQKLAVISATSPTDLDL